MDQTKLTKQMEYEAVALDIAMFQKALEGAFRQKRVASDFTIRDIVVGFANRRIFEAEQDATSETEVQTPQA